MANGQFGWGEGGGRLPALEWGGCGEEDCRRGAANWRVETQERAKIQSFEVWKRVMRWRTCMMGSLRFTLRGCGGCSCCCCGGGCNVVLDADVTAAEEAMMDATQQLQRRCGEGCCDGVAAAAAAMRPCCSSARCARARGGIS